MKTLALILTLGCLGWTVLGDSCVSRCNTGVDYSKNCQCNSHCETYKDCCYDYYSHCLGIGDSCAGRCGSNLDSSKSCQCNSHCSNYGDCCSDYDEACNNNNGGGSGESRWWRGFSDFIRKIFDAGTSYGDGVYGRGYDTGVKHGDGVYGRGYGTGRNHGDEASRHDGGSNGSDSSTSDISTIASLIWNRDVNRATNYHLNYQGKVSDGGYVDHAPHPLFTSLDSSILHKPTYHGFISLLDNYDPHTGNTEHLTHGQLAEIDDFLDAILETEVMKETENFLRYNGKLSGGSTAFKTKLNSVWFELYKRSSSGPVSSSGFEHVFVGETKSSYVTGFHSWLQFYMEEKAHRLNYAGYVSQSQPDIIGSQFTWHGGLRKAKGSFFLGVSPEFDIAIYTICFMMKPNAACRFSINGHSVAIQTYDNSNWPGQQVATAYPM